jgi:YbbR domain-containing protein
MIKHKKELKIIKLLNLKKIKKLLISRAFLGSLFFAFALWVYSALSSEYKTYIDVPLKILLPKNVALETALPEKISVKVKGKGWDIFYLNFFSATANCSVNLSDKEMSEGYYLITRNDIIKGVESFSNVEAIDVMPENLEITTGLIERKKVPVRVKIKVNPREGFIQVAGFASYPDSIIITGNSRVIRKIDYWETARAQFSDIFHLQTVSVSLKDTLKNIITLSQNSVKVKFNVEQTAELVIYDVGIDIRGTENLPKSHMLSPNKINVTIRGGVEQLSEFNPDIITSYIEYRDILGDSTGIIIPHVEVTNNNYHIVSINPPYLYHKKIIN